MPHPLVRDFTAFVKISAYHVLFFIVVSTIGLNIIFGIILDTFNQLRGEQEAAEADMKGKCFICSRDSFEFEAHAKVGVSI